MSGAKHAGSLFPPRLMTDLRPGSRCRVIGPDWTAVGLVIDATPVARTVTYSPPNGPQRTDYFDWGGTASPPGRRLADTSEQPVRIEAGK